MHKFKLISSDSPTSEEEELRSRIELEVDQQLAISRNALVQKKLLIEKAKLERVRKGLKSNKVTSKELQFILENWLDNDRKVLSKSVRLLYNTSTDREFKEVDWVKSILHSLFFSKNLVEAFNNSNHPKILMLKNSEKFNIKTLTNKITLSKRIINMSNELGYEEEILKLHDMLEEKDKLIEALLIDSSWQDKATKLFGEGKKIKEVAVLLDKSESTIKKFSASLNKKLKLEKIVDNN